GCCSPASSLENPQPSVPNFKSIESVCIVMKISTLTFASAITTTLFLSTMSCTAVQEGAITFDAAVPILTTKVVSSPVSSARYWSTAVAPNARGGWNFITQHFQANSGKVAEYVVVDLDTGKFK